MQKIRSIKDAPLKGKRVLVRADLNVPMVSGTVANDLRIKTVVPTLEYIHAAGATQITIIAHLGRPEGKRVESLSLKPVEKRLKELTSTPFILEENLRFDPGEEANDEVFAKNLAALADMYVNEAFSDSHRAHASIVGVPKLIPGYAGLRFIEEIERISVALTPPKGSIAVVGGAKFETKEPLLKKLLDLYSEVLLGGALGNDLVKARGLPFGSSLISSVPVPTDIAENEKLIVAQDAFVSEVGTDKDRVAIIVDTRANESVVDIGPMTAHLWNDKIKAAPFVLWNGPLGLYEKGFTGGTDSLAKTLAESGIPAVVGGGDTVAAIASYSFDPKKVFISTGGGAMLEFIANGTLPGIEALAKN